MFKQFKLISNLTILLIFFLIIPGSFALENHTSDTDIIISLNDGNNPHSYQDIPPNKLDEEENSNNSAPLSNDAPSGVHDIKKDEPTSKYITQTNNTENISINKIDTPNSNSNFKNTIIYSSEIQNTVDNNLNTLPEKYDLRDYGYVTPVKDQGERGTCWSFTALSVLESCILKANGPSYDFSENNLINYIKHSDYGLKESSDAGNSITALAYLLSWAGPVNDIDDPYNSKSTYIPLNNLFHVQNVLFIELNNNLDLKPVKEALMKYGAIGTSLYWNVNNYLKGSSYYNYEHTTTNHAITIVGWDDNYSKYNFYETPAGNGAWIVKNSHGSNFGDNGYFYVSYYDKSINYIDTSIKVYTFILNDTTHYDKNYHYDYAGTTANLQGLSDNLWIKNVYTSNGDEYLAAVSTYFIQDINYDVEILVNDKIQHTQSSKAKAGYYTLKLDKMIPLKKGDQFSIIYKLKSSDGNELLIPISRSKDLKKNNLKPNTSFYSANKLTWQDTEANYTFCIKAFTIQNPMKTTIKLDIVNRTDNSADLIATVYDQYGFLVNSGNVTFKIGDSLEIININKGLAKALNKNLNIGRINVIAEFKSIGYNEATISKVIYNPLVDTKLKLITKSEHNPSDISAYITDLENNPVKSGSVTFTADNKNYNIDVVDGFANLTNIILNIGENHISATYHDLFQYKSSKNNTSFNISLIKSKIELTVNSKENPYEIIAKVSDLNDNPINMGQITFNLPNNTPTINVTNGIAKIRYSFPTTGINTISANYKGNLIYATSNTNKSIDVPKKEVELDHTIKIDGNDLTITTNTQNDIIEYNITISINGHEYGPFNSKNGNVIFNLKNMDDGIYKYTISLNSELYKSKELSGEFKITTEPNTTEHVTTNPTTNTNNIQNTNTLTKQKTKITAKKATFKRKTKIKKYIITLKTDQKAVPQVQVTLKIGKKTYTAKTNNKGKAVFKIKRLRKKGKYIATIRYLGNNKYYKTSVKVKIIIK